jgi:hypothetical protein
MANVSLCAPEVVECERVDFDVAALRFATIPSEPPPNAGSLCGKFALRLMLVI